MKIITLERLGEFLTKCRALFASQTEVAENDEDIETYVLNITDIWYEEHLKFDTSEIA